MPTGSQQRAQRGSLGLVLIHARQPDQRGNEENAAANAHHAGNHPTTTPTSSIIQVIKRLPWTRRKGCRASIQSTEAQRQSTMQGRESNLVRLRKT